MSSYNLFVNIKNVLELIKTFNTLKNIVTLYKMINEIFRSNSTIIVKYKVDCMA